MRSVKHSVVSGARATRGAGPAPTKVAVAEHAIGQTPAGHTEDIEPLLRVDSAGACQELLDCCRQGAIRLSVGYGLTDMVRAAILETSR